MKLQNLGAFDVTCSHYVGVGSDRKRVTETHRVLVQVDPASLAQHLGEDACRNKSRKSILAGGYVQVVNLGTLRDAASNGSSQTEANDEGAERR